MDYRLPYYMAYPIPLQYDDERMERRDFEYMKSMYPAAVKLLLPYVEEECDRMSYEGSVIYDEYPDQLQLYLLCGRIYRKVKEAELEVQMTRNDDWLRDLIHIMVFQELYRRRCVRRKRYR
jgi:hypothetical protein